MENAKKQNALSRSERFKVVGVAVWILMLLGLLMFLGLYLVGLGEFLDEIAVQFRKWRLLRALGMCVVLMFYVIGIPTAIVLFALAAIRGIAGKRTNFTKWLLKALGQKEVPHSDELPPNCSVTPPDV